MKVIALTGRAGSGKDTAGLMIQVLTGNLDPTWRAPGSVGSDGSIDLADFLSAEWRNGPGDVDFWPALKFSYPVYQMAAILTGHDPAMASRLMNEKFKRTEWAIGLKGLKMTGREILQKLGTEFGRDVFGETVWLNRMQDDLLTVQKTNCAGVVITDCRMPNEAQFLRDYWNATIIGLSGRDGGLEQKHSSESELWKIPVDYGLVNDGPYGQLMHKLDDILQELKISNHKYTWT